MNRLPSRFAICVDSSQTWIVTDRVTANDVGAVTYQHSSHGDHYKPWLLVDRQRTKIGGPLSQLEQAAQAVEGEVLKRAVISGKRDRDIELHAGITWREYPMGNGDAPPEGWPNGRGSAPSGRG